ncbi:MAG: isoprenylcysteine carboxyl methyltransferase [Gammaproteobacteria bacterium CG22_combo_CG10-13_8_21_14_all_40_8]|nr:MAG: isoprenylcysteine carboxyl methyltransferase [Gammaproteobacteria bacterium CG22_combo_CG10-13_8_21_14_all_40_8]
MPSINPMFIGAVMGLSEIGLAIFKRSGGDAQSKDGGTLAKLWIIITLCISIASIVPHMVSQATITINLNEIALVVFIFGWFLRWYSIIYLGKFFTVNVAIAQDHRVIDTGPYRFIRHPSYTGLLLELLGFGLFLQNWLSLTILLVPITLAFVNRMAVEEKALESFLGIAYANYKARTKRLIPGVY